MEFGRKAAGAQVGAWCGAVSALRACRWASQPSWQ